MCCCGSSLYECMLLVLLSCCPIVVVIVCVDEVEVDDNVDGICQGLISLLSSSFFFLSISSSLVLLSIVLLTLVELIVGEGKFGGKMGCDSSDDFAVVTFGRFSCESGARASLASPDGGRSCTLSIDGVVAVDDVHEVEVDVDKLVLVLMFLDVVVAVTVTVTVVVGVDELVRDDNVKLLKLFVSVDVVTLAAAVRNVQ